MSKILSHLLQKPEALVANTVAKLEEKTGFPSHDVRLLADINLAVRNKVRDLGLDPQDTTGEELQHALQARFERDTQQVERAFGIDASSSRQQRLAKAVALALQMATDSEAWVIKSRPAKELLKTQPPKKTMKILHYRSAGSMIKREDVAVLYVVAAAVESASWNKTLQTRLSKLSSSDYELKPVRVVNLPDKLVSVPRHNPAVSSLAIGAAAIWPSDTQNPAVLPMAIFLYEELQAVCLQSHKHHLLNVNPVLRWWADTDHLLAWNNGEPVSLNLRDAALGALHQLPYNRRSRQHAGTHLWSELLLRYEQDLTDLPAELAKAAPEMVSKTKRMISPLGQMVPEYSEAG